MVYPQAQKKELSEEQRDELKKKDENEASIKDYIQLEEGMEDIRLSTTLFNQVKVADFISLYFSITAVGLAIVAREKDYEQFQNGVRKTDS